MRKFESLVQPPVLSLLADNQRRRVEYLGSMLLALANSLYTTIVTREMELLKLSLLSQHRLGKPSRVFQDSADPDQLELSIVWQYRQSWKISR